MVGVLPGGDPELARERGLGVVAKRPIANAVWLNDTLPESEYVRPYWERLRKLDYDFLRGEEALSTALRFTLAAPWVHTAIVGTTRPGRYAQNAALLDAGPLPLEEVERIRSRWREVADDTWTGET